MRVSGGDRIGVPAVVLEAGGVAETVNVSAEALLVQSQSAERSFAVSSEQIENLPVNRQNFTSLIQFAPGVASGGSTDFVRLGGQSQNNLMMDGISAMDTGNNGTMLAMNIDVHRRSEDPDPGYQAEYGRVERAADLGRHQERHQPVPRLDVRPRAELRLEREPVGRRGQRRSQGRYRETGIGATRSAVRSASPAARTSCSSSTATNSVRAPPIRRRTNRFRVPTVFERSGDFSQSLDNNGDLFITISVDRSLECTVGGSSRQLASSAEFRLIAWTDILGLNILKPWPEPNRKASANYNLESRRRPSTT